jgi:hypothetical protein
MTETRMINITASIIATGLRVFQPNNHPAVPEPCKALGYRQGMANPRLRFFIESAEGAARISCSNFLD